MVATLLPEKALRPLNYTIRALALGMCLILAGCSSNPVYTTTGVVLASYAEKEAAPYVMETTDPVLACSLGLSLEPLVYSFSRVMDAPDTVGSLLMLLAANCAEYEAMEVELSYLRENYEGNVSAAKDYRERTKRLNSQIAKRRLIAFNRAMSAYEFDPAAENLECPFLYTEQDELTFLFGVLTGLQAIVNDANSGARAGVPRNIAPQAERAARCIANEKWAGIPNAVRALVWLLLPDTQPHLAANPWDVLEDSVQLGIDQGFRVSSALKIIAAETFGKPEAMEEALKEFAAAEKNMKTSETFALLDTVAKKLVMHASDKHWVSNYGYRTPSSSFGRLSPSNPGENVETMSLDDLL